MKIKNRTNLKFVATVLFLSSFIFSLNTIKTSATATGNVVTVPPITSNFETNTLNIDTAIVVPYTESKLEGVDNVVKAKIVEKNQGVKVTFSNVPSIPEGDRLFAVMVDAVYYDKDGTGNKIISKQYLDENNSVTFDNVPEYIKIPGIHLYIERSEDHYIDPMPIFPWNFVASTSCLMPYALEDGDGSVVDVTDDKEDESGKPIVIAKGGAKIYATTVPCIYSLKIPKSVIEAYYNYKPGAKKEEIKPENIFAAVLSNDIHGDHNDRGDYGEGTRQWVSIVEEDTVNGDTDDPDFCKFKFLVPGAPNLPTSDFEVHLYNKILEKENFLFKIKYKIRDREN